MRKFVLLFMSLTLLVIGGGCANSARESRTKEDAQTQIVQTFDVARYKLFPTQNMWTFLKLDTQTGQMWQVQYSVNDDKERFEYDLNPNPLITNAKMVNGRFELYPTSNIYNFILLDQIDGKSWQVQWSFDEVNRAILPISK